MTTVLPSALSTAAQDLTGLLDEAVIPANVIPPAADEISVAITELFNGHASWYQGLITEAEGFSRQFTGILSAAAMAYQETEGAAQDTLRGGVTQAELDLGVTSLLSAYTGPNTPAPPVPTNINPVTLVVGGTTTPVAPPSVVGPASGLYGLKNPYAIWTPEQFWPLTPSLGSLGITTSAAIGGRDLVAQILPQLAAGNTVTVWGVSQGAMVETNAIRTLMAQGSPGVGQLSFILTGDPNNPNGGPWERFVGGYIPILDASFNGATPPNSPYPTQIYTNQYDLASDFPRYPLNGISDLNAVMGFFEARHYYLYPTSSYMQLPTSPGYTGNTTYYFQLDQTLPLVQPLRDYVQAPFGNAFADLLQPDLRVLVDMGYSTNQYANYANIPTPASLFEIPNPFTIIPDLGIGTVQGVQGFAHDLGAPVSAPSGYPYNPELNPDLNFDLPQSSTTGLSVLLGIEGGAAETLFPA